MPSHAWIFCSSPQPPPWQHWWWQRASSGACVPLSLIAKKMASTVCANTETIMTMRSGSPLWAPKSPCLPTSFRTKAKATRRRCMPTKSEEHSKSFCLLSVLFEAQPPPRCLPKIKHLTHEDHHELDLHLFLWPVWRGWRLFLLHQYILRTLSLSSCQCLDCRGCFSSFSLQISLINLFNIWSKEEINKRRVEKVVHSTFVVIQPLQQLASLFCFVFFVVVVVVIRANQESCKTTTHPARLRHQAEMSK